MELPPKTKISGKTAKAAVTDSEESENEEKIKPSKIRKVENKHKVTYDKSNENCETISKLKEKGNKLGAVTPKKNKRKVDVSAWDELHVPESIKEALSEMGLSTPTPIQVDNFTVTSVFVNDFFFLSVILLSFILSFHS